MVTSAQKANPGILWHHIPQAKVGFQAVSFNIRKEGCRKESLVPKINRERKVKEMSDWINLDLIPEARVGLTIELQKV
jgi:hypothetical protein